MVFESFLPFVLSLAPLLLGFVYAFAGGGKRKMIRERGVSQVLGFGSWFALNVNTRKRTVVYFWTVFLSPYLTFLLTAFVFAPAMLAQSPAFLSFGLLSSTVGAVVIESVRHKVDMMLGQSEEPMSTGHSQ